MSDESPPSAPAAPAAPVPEPLPPRLPDESRGGEAGAVQGSRGGCLKWGLIGCGGLSALLIVGLVFMGTKAPDFLESLLRLHERQVLAAATPEVTAEEKAAFQRTFDAFVQRAKAGKAPISQIRDVSTKAGNALLDQSVTPDELRGLTAAAEAGAGGAPGDNK